MTTSNQLQNALAFLSHMENRDYIAMATTMSSDFTHRALPASLGLLTRDKEQFLKRAKSFENVFERLNFQILEAIQGKDVVVIHMTSDGKMKSGQQYKNEYMFIFRFEPEGERILNVKEFFDSQYYVKVMLGGQNAE